MPRAPDKADTITQRKICARTTVYSLHKRLGRSVKWIRFRCMYEYGKPIGDILHSQEVTRKFSQNLDIVLSHLLAIGDRTFAEAKAHTTRCGALASARNTPTCKTRHRSVTKKLLALCYSISPPKQKQLIIYFIRSMQTVSSPKKLPTS